MLKIILPYSLTQFAKLLRQQRGKHAGIVRNKALRLGIVIGQQRCELSQQCRAIFLG